VTVKRLWRPSVVFTGAWGGEGSTRLRAEGRKDVGAG
jgi:hypothetical protein